jgi:hypothetical protein
MGKTTWPKTSLKMSVVSTETQHVASTWQWMGVPRSFRTLQIEIQKAQPAVAKNG